MNRLRTLTNPALLSETGQLAREERRISLEVIEHFREVERRKAYADLDFKSLFDYAVKGLHYSEGSAARRIAAMRALKDFPDLAERIQSGMTSVTSIAKIHTTLRRDEKLSKTTRTSTEKKKIFSEMSLLPGKELERQLFTLAPQAAVQEKIRPLTADLHEVKIYLTSEELQSFQELGGWLAHSLSVPGSPSEVVRKLIQIGRERYLYAIRPRERARRPCQEPSWPCERPSRPSRSRSGISRPDNGAKINKAVQRDASPSAVERQRSEILDTGHTVKDTPEPSFTQQRSLWVSMGMSHKGLSRHDRRTAFRRSNQNCEHIDSTGRRCGSRHFLQIEHRKPRAKGGGNEIENLEVLCRDHNLIRGIKIFGVEKMRRIDSRSFVHFGRSESG